MTFFVPGSLSAAAQNSLPDEKTTDRLPNGKSQSEAIIKADYEKTLKDADDLIELATSLKTDIEKETQHVLSISSIKKTEDIEKLARRIRSRLKRN